MKKETFWFKFWRAIDDILACDCEFDPIRPIFCKHCGTQNPATMRT